MPQSVFTAAYAQFLKELIAARKRAGLTQAELGRKINKDQRFISQIELGVRRLDVIEFFVIAGGLGLDPGQFYAAIASKLPQDVAI